MVDRAQVPFLSPNVTYDLQEKAAVLVFYPEFAGDNKWANSCDVALGKTVINIPITYSINVTSITH